MIAFRLGVAITVLAVIAMAVAAAMTLVGPLAAEGARPGEVAGRSPPAPDARVPGAPVQGAGPPPRSGAPASPADGRGRPDPRSSPAEGGTAPGSTPRTGAGAREGVSREGCDLSSAEATVKSAVAALVAGRDRDFADTFLPDVVRQLDPDLIARCRARVIAAPVRPDWEVAEERVVAGRRVRLVSMYGKSMTGFHDVAGRWLADRIWCAPAQF